MTGAAATACVVLTPGLGGADGIAALSRMAVRALAPPATAAPLRVVSLADPPSAGDAMPMGARLWASGGSKARFVAGAVRAGLGARSGVVICLHLHLAVVGRLAAALRGGRLAVFLVGIEAWRPLSAAERWALSAAALIAASEHTARRFRAANPAWAARPIAICHPGVPPGEPAPWERGAAFDPSAAALPDDASPFALIVARMAASERYKGHDLLLDLWPRVRAACPRAVLVVVGDGDDRARLERRAALLGASVRFTGRVPARALERLYRAAALFVMPSPDEGFGLVFLEAMRAGAACIGGPGAAAEVIEDGVTGVVVDPTEPEAVLAAIVRLFAEPETRAAMGRAGAARLARQFTEARFQERMRAVLGLGDAAG